MSVMLMEIMGALTFRLRSLIVASSSVCLSAPNDPTSRPVTCNKVGTHVIMEIISLGSKASAYDV